MAGPYGGGITGADGGNPFVSGLVNATNIAGAIKEQAIAQQNAALAQAREARAAQEQQSNTDLQDADLSTRLTNMGAKKATNQDLIDSQTGALPNKIVPFNGTKWVLPTQAQMDERQATQNTVKANQEGAFEGAKQTAIEKSKIQFRNDQRTNEGHKLDPELAKQIGADPNVSYLDSERKDMETAYAAMTTAHARQQTADAAELRAATDANRNKVSSTSYDDKGYATEHYENGSSKMVDQPGKPSGKSKTVAAGTSEGRLAKKAADETKLDQTASQISLDPAVTDFASADALLRKQAQTDPYIKQNYLLIRKRIKDADKKTAAETNADTVNSLFGSDSDTAGGTAKPAGTPAAKPKPFVPSGPAANAGGPAISVTLPNGHVKNFPDQKSADAFKLAAHIK